MGPADFASPLICKAPHSFASPSTTDVEAAASPVACGSSWSVPCKGPSDSGRGNFRVAIALFVGIALGTAGTAWALNKTGGGDLFTIVPAPKSAPPEYLAATPVNNSCLLPNLVIPRGPTNFNACNFVVQSTDEVWNTRHVSDSVIERYFDENYILAGSWGQRSIGLEELKASIYGEMRAFPDIKIHITDCSCKGNDLDGYKCFMSDVLEGTNTGVSRWGPATNRYARWTGIIESFVRLSNRTGQWQYIAEWAAHDERSLLWQLGLDVAKVPEATGSVEPIHHCEPLLHIGQTPAVDAADVRIQRAHT